MRSCARRARRVFCHYGIVKTRRLDGSSWQLMLDKIDAVFLVSPTDLVLEAEELSKTLLEAMPTYGKRQLAGPGSQN